MLKCLVFGHKAAPYSYGTVRIGTVDNLGREHATVHGTCTRCDQTFQIAQIHLPVRQNERKLITRLQELDGALEDRDAMAAMQSDLRDQLEDHRTLLKEASVLLAEADAQLQSIAQPVALTAGLIRREDLKASLEAAEKEANGWWEVKNPTSALRSMAQGALTILDKLKSQYHFPISVTELPFDNADPQDLPPEKSKKPRKRRASYTVGNKQKADALAEQFKALTPFTLDGKRTVVGAVASHHRAHYDKTAEQYLDETPYWGIVFRWQYSDRPDLGEFGGAFTWNAPVVLEQVQKYKKLLE